MWPFSEKCWGSGNMTRWLPVLNYEGLYEVSDDGEVRRNGRILKPAAAPTGHLHVTLTQRSREKTFFVHRLVLIAFVGPPPEGMIARHYPDRDPTNNRLENLSWATRKTNANDCIEHGTLSSGERHGMSRLTWQDVGAIRAIQGQRAETAKRFGVSPSYIDKIRDGKAWRSLR